MEEATDFTAPGCVICDENTLEAAYSITLKLAVNQAYVFGQGSNDYNNVALMLQIAGRAMAASVG